VIFIVDQSQSSGKVAFGAYGFRLKGGDINTTKKDFEMIAIIKK